MTTPDYTTTGTWHDHAPVVAEEAGNLLRMTGADPDLAGLEALARAGMRAIDERLALQPATGRMFYAVSDVWSVTSYHPDRVPPDVLEAARQLTVELYRRRDAAFGVINAWSPSGEPLRISRDQLAGVDSLLQPHVEGWGLA